MPDFSVDLEALATAANGIKDVLDELGTHQVADIDCNPDSFGHDRLAATVRDFCGRWQNGVTALTQDGAEIADRLTQTVLTYQRADTMAMDALTQTAARLDPARGLEAM